LILESEQTLSQNHHAIHLMKFAKNTPSSGHQTGVIEMTEIPYHCQHDVPEENLLFRDCLKTSRVKD